MIRCRLVSDVNIHVFVIEPLLSLTCNTVYFNDSNFHILILYMLHFTSVFLSSFFVVIISSEGANKSSVS